MSDMSKYIKKSDIKCPICQTLLDVAIMSDKVFGCPKCRNMGNIDLWQKLDCTRKALEFITRISGAGMSYQDMFIDAHEVAKFALGQIKCPVLIGRYDKEMTDLLRGCNNE